MKISVIQAMLWALGAYFSTGLGFLLALAVSPSVEHDPVPQAAIQAAVYLALCALFAGRRPGRSWSETFAMRRTSVWLVLLAVLFGIAICHPAQALAGLMTHIWPLPAAVREANDIWFSPRSLGHGIALFVFAAGITPFAEELLFRGALYTGLRPNQTAASAGWTTGLLFTLSHLEPRFWPSLIILALLMATLRAVSGSLWPSLFMHVAFNATGLAMPFAPPPLKEPGLGIVLGCVPVAALILGAIVWIGRSSASADRARRVDLEPDPGIGETDP